MLIERGTLTREALRGQCVVVTGAGRGIGYETARTLAWLGASVVLAELDESTGRQAEINLRREFGENSALWVKTDVGEKIEVERLLNASERAFKKIDAVINNAVALPMGAVRDVPIEAWDRSYAVNLRGPVLLARAVLPGMLLRRHGAFVCVSSSGAVPFMGPYEVFKTAQVELANTLFAELEGTGVHAFTIGPGIVRTPGFEEGGGKVAKLMGISLDELLEMNKGLALSPEAAGAGFAAAVALAERFDGQETSSVQVLRDIGIVLEQEAGAGSASGRSERAAPLDWVVIKERCRAVGSTYEQQAEGWKKRNIFEKQWLARDFKKQTGKSIEEMRGLLATLAVEVEAGHEVRPFREPLRKLAAYYRHQEKLLQGFEKDPARLKTGREAIQAWIGEVEALLDQTGGGLDEN